MWLDARLRHVADDVGDRNDGRRGGRAAGHGPMDLRMTNALRSSMKNTQGAIPAGAMRHKEILRKAREHPPWSGRPEEGRLRGRLSRPEIWHRLRPCAQGLRHRRGIRPCDDRVRRERDASSSLMPHMKSAPARRHPRRSWWPISSASRPRRSNLAKWPQMPLDRNITGREPLRLRNRPARLRSPAA